jgi:GNAT superfamily N-acetyltransferase
VDWPYRIETLTGQHDRKRFCCGIAPLDRYFRDQVTQDIRRRVTTCYVAVADETNDVAGYYSLAAGSIPLNELPDTLGKKLPRYPSVPVARLGRLAVDQAHQGRQVGIGLLWDATARAMRADMGVFAVVVDAKDDRAEAFYRKHGFLAFGGARQLILPLKAFSGATG